MPFHHQSISSIGDLQSVVKGADVIPSQLGLGEIRGSLFHAEFAGITFSNGHFTGNVDIQGALSVDNLTLGMLLNAEGPSHQWLQSIDIHDVGVFPAGSEQHAIYRKNTTYVTVSFPEDNLLEYAETQKLFIDSRILRTACMHASSSLATTVSRDLVEYSRCYTEAFSNPILAEELRGRIFVGYLGALEKQPDGGFGKEYRPRRESIVRDALSYIRELGTPSKVTVEQLCVVTNCPRRTLHRAFVETIGLPPARYLQFLRLSGARQDLKSSCPESNSTVTQVAERWGFYRMGQFANDYREMFGENPSTTRKLSLVIR